MFNAATLPSETHLNLIGFQDDREITGTRSSKKSRQRALYRVLQREHRRQMQAALRNEALPDTMEEDTLCHECGSTLAECTCCPGCCEFHCVCGLDDLNDLDSRGDDNCPTCRRLNCECSDDDSDDRGVYFDFDADYPDFYPQDDWYRRSSSFHGQEDVFLFPPFHSQDDVLYFLSLHGGADLLEAVDKLKDGYRHPIDPEKLKLHDFFWEQHDNEKEWEMHLHEMGYYGDVALAAPTSDLEAVDSEILFGLLEQPEPIVVDFPKTRNFTLLQGGRLKKVKGRHDGYYGGNGRDLNDRRITREREDHLVAMEEFEQLRQEAEHVRRQREQVRSRLHDVQTSEPPKPKKSRRRSSSKAKPVSVVEVYKLVKPEHRTRPRLTLVGYIVPDGDRGTRFVAEGELAA